MADFITQFTAEEYVSRDNFNSRIAEANAALSNKAPAGYGLGATSKDISNQDWLDILAQNAGGWYSGSNVVNAPTTIDGGTGWYTFIINPFPDVLNTEQYQTCIAISAYYKKIYFGRRYAGLWGGWVEIATTVPPTWYNLTPASGYTVGTAYLRYCKDGGGTVLLTGAVQKSSAPTSGETMMILPEGFRPANYVSFVVAQLAGATVAPWCSVCCVEPSGAVRFYSGTTPPNFATNKDLVINVAFPAATV